MNEDKGQLQRRLRVQTRYEAVEGVLRSSGKLRMLDELNSLSSPFVTVHTPAASSGDWQLEDGPLAISLGSILFVLELSKPLPLPNDVARAIEASRFTRTAIRLRVGDYCVQGFVHVLPGGNALARLHHHRDPFLALTSASVSGPECKFVTPFVAVNRSHILTGQEIPQEGLAAAG